MLFACLLFYQALAGGLNMKSFRNRIVIALVSLLALGVWISLVPYAAATGQATRPQKFHMKPQQRGKPTLRRAGSGYKVKKGAEVAAKVTKLRQSNKDVGAAFKFVEDKKRTHKINNSFAITGKLGSLQAQLLPGGPTLEKASFMQTSVVTGSDVELIFVPVLNDDMEWQGTVISNLYDSSGAVVGQYVAESILIMPDPNLYAWDEVYEAPVYNGVVLGAISQPGMFTNLDFGIPLNQQQVSKEMNGPNHSGSIQAVLAGYPQGGGALIRSWANCTFGWCGGGGYTCVGTDLWSADVLNSSCFAAGCGNYAIGCAWGTIWR
jgi:hypothetical protein